MNRTRHLRQDEMRLLRQIATDCGPVVMIHAVAGFVGNDVPDLHEATALRSRLMAVAKDVKAAIDRPGRPLIDVIDLD